MATFNTDYYYGGKNLGLKVCPFNPNHKMKDSKYLRHVLKCEQQFPKTSTLNTSAKQIFSSMDSISTAKSETTGCEQSLVYSMKSLSTSEDWTQNYRNDSQMTTSSSGDGQANCGPTESCTISAEINEIIRSETESNKLMPKQIDVNIETQTEVQIITHTIEGTGDPDNWDSNAKAFSICDKTTDLTDEQMDEMANSFVDPIVLAQMDKKQRKVFYDKLNELKAIERERKLKALNELAALRDECDPQLMAIPSEIRKPRVDIRKMFRLNKRFNSLMKRNSTQLSPIKSTECLTADICTEIPVHSGHAVQCEDIKCLDTQCNGCHQSLSLTEENIKRLTVFCSDCSGSKFGGYFECHSCNLYGYFAKSQISEHLNKHFPNAIV